MKQRILWLDLVRLLAILMLICCHSADGFNFFPGPEPDNIADYQWWGAAWGSFMRPCVPLFAMLTGALLLPVKEESWPFIKKRVGRVLWPFLIWSVIYGMFPWFLGVIGAAPETILKFFPYSGEEAMSQSLSVSLGYVYQIPLNFNIIAVHMWYIYMLIGLYLYLPVFSAWVRQASEKEKGWFLVVWCVTLFIPYIHHFVSPTLWGECDWNSFGMLYYFAGFNGYLLLGHYLRNHILKPAKAIPLGIILFCVGYAITLSGFKYIQSIPHEGADLELFWFYCSPQVVMMTAGIFLAVASLGETLNEHAQGLTKWGASLTRCGFGIYMIHYFMTGPFVVMMRNLGVPVALQIPCGAVLVFIISWSITALVHKALGKYGKYILG